jgi:hypothetical protein
MADMDAALDTCDYEARVSKLASATERGCESFAPERLARDIVDGAPAAL